MCKSLELREHGVSKPIFNSAKRKNTLRRGQTKGEPRLMMRGRQGDEQ